MSDPENNLVAWLWVAGGLVLVTGASLYFVWAIFWRRRYEGRAGKRAAEAPEEPYLDLVGEEGVVKVDLTPEGSCDILGGARPCRSDTGETVVAGTRIVVVGYDGGRFLVRPTGQAAGDFA